MQANLDAAALNTTHRSSDGSDHTFLDQSVISGATPTFTGTNITGILAANVSIADAGAIITATDVEGALQENRTAINLNTTHSSSNGTDHANVVLNDTHRASDGSDHTFLDQSVISGATPTFTGTNITGVLAANVPIVDSGALITATDTEGAFAENRALIDTNTSHSGTTHDYAYITGNDGATNVTAAELEELTDGSSTSLHTHAAGVDELVKIDAAATAGYIGAASGDGVLRTGTGLSYVDGGNFVTLAVDADYTDVSSNDAATDVTGAELEELTDGSVTALHSHAGGGVSLQTAFDSGTDITVANTDNQTLTFTQNDTTNNPNAITIVNTGTGTPLEIDNDGTGHGLHLHQDGVRTASKFNLYVDSTGINTTGLNAFIATTNASTTGDNAWVSNTGTGTCLNVVQNTALAGGKHGLYVQSNVAHVNADSALVRILQDSGTASEPALEIKNDGTGDCCQFLNYGTGNGVHIEQITGVPTTGTHALYVASIVNLTK
jgi:hypothetical protein